MKFKLNGARANQAFCFNGKFYKLNKGVLPKDVFEYAKKKFKIKEVKEKKNGE